MNFSAHFDRIRMARVASDSGALPSPTVRRRSGEFGVSLLAAGQEGVAQHFARGVPPIAIWEGIDVRAGAGPPLVAGAIGWVTGRVSAEVPTGEDTFFVGEVLSLEEGARERPLVYVDRDYVSA